MTRSWRHQFNLIHDDLEREELRRRISDFEGTIFTRLNELGRVCDSKVEKNEIAEAMQTHSSLPNRKTKLSRLWRMLDANRRCPTSVASRAESIRICTLPYSS